MNFYLLRLLFLSISTYISTLEPMNHASESETNQSYDYSTQKILILCTLEKSSGVTEYVKNLYTCMLENQVSTHLIIHEHSPLKEALLGCHKRHYSSK